MFFKVFFVLYASGDCFETENLDTFPLCYNILYIK